MIYILSICCSLQNRYSLDRERRLVIASPKDTDHLLYMAGKVSGLGDSFKEMKDEHTFLCVAQQTLVAYAELKAGFFVRRETTCSYLRITDISEELLWLFKPKTGNESSLPQTLSHHHSEAKTTHRTNKLNTLQQIKDTKELPL